VSGADQVLPLKVTTSACRRPPATAHESGPEQETAEAAMPSDTGADQCAPSNVLTWALKLPPSTAQKRTDGHETP
jgi:hypothetical protein